MKINNFWGDLTDILAKKEALLAADGYAQDSREDVAASGLPSRCMILGNETSDFSQ